MHDHQEMMDTIPAYALGALEQQESEQLAMHIASCSECQAELRRYQQTVDLLGLAAPDHQPSPEVKERLLSQINSDQSLVTRRQPASWRERFSRQPAWVFVSAGLLLLLAVSNLLLWDQVRTFRTQAFRFVTLSATDSMPEANGIIIISADGKYGTLVASDLTPLANQQQYQLWLIKGEKRVNGGVFSVADSGYAALKVYSSQPLASYDGFGITIEPYGGSPGPTGDKVLGGEF